MGFKDFLSAQLRQPSGLVGRWLMGTMLDRGNACINAHTLEALAIAPGDDVLEVGFGGGGTLARAAAQAGEGTAVGIDFSRPMVQRARRTLRAQIAAGCIEVFEGDVHQLPFEDGRFDKAYSVNTLYFWAEPVVALRELRRVLQPDGRLVLALRSPAVIERLDLSREVFTAYAPEAARELALAAGFQEAAMTHRDQGEKVDSVLVIARA